ncbi:MAG: PIG-L family deacetylase [bacterium]|nr:PIG-L family deacetylase [bacterium]
MTFRLFASTVLVVTLHVVTTAQQLRPAPAAVIYGELQRLRSLTSVLYVAAHPDDENTRLLAWLVNGRYIRTGYLSVTRGDGGQNILGSEQGPALGLIRTHELLAARALDGATQSFTRAIDFGFSKNPEETFEHWDEKVLLGDVVWAYRTLRPDVVICRFPKDSMAGHGHHSASAILAEKAYALSGDPNAYPEQLTRTSVWKPTRLLFNAFRFGNRSTVREGMFKLEVGQYDPLMGMGFGELAGISRSIHRSQGAGTPSVPGVQSEFFALLAGQPLTTSLFEGIDTTWTRVQRPDIGADVDAIAASFDMLHPERSLPALFAVRKKIATVGDEFWRAQKLKEVETIIVHSMGLVAEAVTTSPIAIAGDRVPVTARVTARAGQTVKLVNIVWPDGPSRASVALEHDSLRSMVDTVEIPATTPITQPYWLEKDATSAQFVIPGYSVLGLPTTPSSLLVTMFLAYGTDTFSVQMPLSFKKLDPLKGDVVEALRIVPLVSIEPELPIAFFDLERFAEISVRLRAFAQISNASLRYTDTEGVVHSIDAINIKANTDTLINLIATSTMMKRDHMVNIELHTDRGVFSRSVKTINYDHLPTLQYTKGASVRVLRADWAVKAKKVAFIEGAGDFMPDFLRLAGLQVDEIGDAEILNTEQLLKYDAVVTGVRIVNTKKSMQYLMPALLRYVQEGGTLIMQYNTLQDMATRELGPYPFKLSSKRVTEEDAAVRITNADHPLLTVPNKILPSDFDGWVQERGLYFPDAIDAQYSTMLSMNDTNEEPLNSAIIHAKYGRGHYIYCSLSLFRQLPAGVRGPMRLLMNMLSVGK